MIVGFRHIRYGLVEMDSKKIALTKKIQERQEQGLLKGVRIAVKGACTQGKQVCLDLGATPDYGLRPLKEALVASSQTKTNKGASKDEPIPHVLGSEPVAAVPGGWSPLGRRP
jgi:hypothetical protein